MARDFNQNRIANAILKKGTIAGYGNHWAFNDKADGFNVVNVTVPNIPLDVKQYLEGDEDLTIYGVGTDVSKLCAYSLASFPKLEKVYLLNYTDVVDLKTNWDASLVYLDEIYVPESLLSEYQRLNPNETRFKILVEQATLEIPYIDTDVLTTEYVDTIIAGLLESSLPLITKVVIDDRFTQESADYIAWNYDFSMLTNLNNNIWYGVTQYDFSVLMISGSGALTNAMVEQAIEEVPSSKRSAITKVVVSNAFDEVTLNDLTNILSSISILPNNIELTLNISTTALSGKFIPTSNVTKLNFNNQNGNGGNYMVIESTTLLELNVNIPSGTNIRYIELDNPDKTNVLKSFSVTATQENRISPLVSYYNAVTYLRNIEKFAFYGNAWAYMFSNYMRNLGADTTNGAKVYFENKTNKSVFYAGTGAIGWNVDKMYVPTELLADYLQDTNFSSISSKIVGFLDYTDTIPTFSGYTDQWYTDEDCTTLIVTTDFVSGNRYYVKLTAI